MGNRAVITTSRSTDPQHDRSSIGVYLHWNGGPTSVQSFLDYCKMKGYRSPTYDCYGWACLCGVITNFFGVAAPAALMFAAILTAPTGTMAPTLSTTGTLWAISTATPAVILTTSLKCFLILMMLCQSVCSSAMTRSWRSGTNGTHRSHPGRRTDDENDDLHPRLYRRQGLL